MTIVRFLCIYYITKRGKMASREVIKILREAGWVEQPKRGTSHRQFKHPDKPGKVTVPEHKGKDIPSEILKSIEKQSGTKLR